MDLLNDKQREVVTHRGSPLVCFAAAGTGKTQALTCRIASLIKDDGVNPDKIIALTFTIKAANEMKQRAALYSSSTKTNVNQHDLKYVSTFHSFCLKLLRKFSNNKIFRQISDMTNNNKENFQVIDPRGSLKILKDVISSPQNEKIVNHLCKLDKDFNEKHIDKQAQDVYYVMEKWRNDGLLPDDVFRDIQAESESGSGSEKNKNKYKRQNTDLEKTRLIAELYQEYRKKCGSQCVIDFSDLILLATRLLETDKELCLYCRSELFEHMLVDEFQDCNEAQMSLINVLVRSHKDKHTLKETGTENIYTPRLVENNLMVVGDDYQAIHEWRGARVKNILDFESSFDNVKTVILSLNYRSLKEIIRAASNVIRNNKNQKDKSLECTRILNIRDIENIKNINLSKDPRKKQQNDDVIQYSVCDDQYNEGLKVVQYIKKYVMENGGKYRDCAVLYRNHALSLPIEEHLKAENIPYIIKGSLSFFDRAEIGVAMAFLRFLYAQNDDDLIKILLTCAKGVGQGRIDKMMKECEDSGDSLWDHICKLVRVKTKSRAKREIEVYNSLKTCKDILGEYIVKMNQSGSGESLTILLKNLLSEIGYTDILEKEMERNKDKSMSNDRLENLETFYTFIKRNEDCNQGKLTLCDLIDIIAMDSSISSSEDGEKEKEEEKEEENERDNKVVLMTLHSSKGLEWPFVSIIGCDDGTIPYYRSGIEEERRLFYVGLTRARDKLLLTCPKMRSMYNKLSDRKLSPFWREMNEEF